MYKDSYRHRRKFYITLFTSIYVIIFAICSLVIIANWKYVKLLFTPQEKQLTIEQYQFNELFNKVKNLEELSKEYNEENYQLRTIAYIRSSQYNGEVWDDLAFEDLSAFEIYVLQNQGNSKVSSLKTLGSNYTFVVPNTKKEVDFYHMFAVMNAMYLPDMDMQDILGWGGDLCQLAASFADTELTGDDLLNAIRSNMNSTSVFGKADRNADFDAVNIMTLVTNNKLMFNSVYLSSIMYYGIADEEVQIQSFKEYLGVEYYSQTEIEEILYERLRENMYVQLLADDFGLDYPDLGEDEEALEIEIEIDGELVTVASPAGIYRACIKAFVETIKV